MSVTMVVGLSFGDESKACFCDRIIRRKDEVPVSFGMGIDIVCRSTGGSNCGHTVYYNNEKVVLRLLPTGALHNKKSVLGNGMVINLKILKEEVEKAQSFGFDKKNLFISKNAHIVLDRHIRQDIEAEHDSEKPIGTTKNGIGPCYVDKYSRIGVRINDLLGNDVRRDLAHYVDYFKANICDTTDFLLDNLDKNIFVEGSQAFGLDIDQGSYPFVTSSSCTSAGLCVGLGLPPKSVTHVDGVFKIYDTRVGNGPFPTELNTDVPNSIGARIAMKGREFGSATGRPRRIGWLDLTCIKKACRVNGVTSLALAKIDVLKDNFEQVLVRVGGSDDEPEYKEFKGWANNMPRHIIEFIEEYLGIHIGMVSFGPNPEDYYINSVLY